MGQCFVLVWDRMPRARVWMEVRVQRSQRLERQSMAQEKGCGGGGRARGHGSQLRRTSILTASTIASAVGVHRRST